MNDAFRNWYVAPTDVLTPAAQRVYLNSFERLHLDLLDDANAAIGAYNAIVERDRCSSTLLEPLREAALSKRRHLWDLASTLIGKLALRFDHAGELIQSLLKESSWEARFVALCCIQKKTARPLMLEVIGGAIDDRSGEVRWKAAEQAERFQLKELIAYIEKQLTKEQNKKAQASLQNSLGLLRDGYLANVDEDGNLHLAVRYSKARSGGRFLKGEWESRDLSDLADEVRENLERTSPLGRTIGPS